MGWNCGETAGLLFSAFFWLATKSNYRDSRNGGKQEMQRALLHDGLARTCESKENIQQWLWNCALIGDFDGNCGHCKEGKLRLRKDKSLSGGFVWHCSCSDKCTFRESIHAALWFEGSKLPTDMIPKLTYHWVYKALQDFVQRELQLSEHTSVDWNDFCQEVCCKIMQPDCEQIGGPGTIVETDKSKFGKRKYNRQRRVDSVWVFGGIESGTNKHFFEVVGDQSADTLVPIIKRWVQPGTETRSDCWKAPSQLLNEGYTKLSTTVRNL